MHSVELDEPTRKRLILEQLSNSPLCVQSPGDAVNRFHDGLLDRREVIPTQKARNKQVSLLFVSPQLLLIEKGHATLLFVETPLHGRRVYCLNLLAPPLPGYL